MDLKTIFLSIAAVAILLILPSAMVWSMVQHFRTPPSKRPGGGSMSNSVGAGLQELDRLLVRPSVEHQIEAENRVLKREDDEGGE